jgi:chromosome segregation ATPase
MNAFVNIMSDYLSSVEAMKDEIVELERSISELTSVCVTEQKSLEEFNKHISELEEQLKSRDATITKLTDMSRTLREKLAQKGVEYETSIKILKDTNNLNDVEINRLKSENDVIASQLEDSEAEKVRLEEERKEYIRAAQLSDERLASVREHIAYAQGTLRNKRRKVVNTSTITRIEENTNRRQDDNDDGGDIVVDDGEERPVVLRGQRLRNKQK